MKPATSTATMAIVTKEGQLKLKPIKIFAPLLLVRLLRATRLLGCSRFILRTEG